MNKTHPISEPIGNTEQLPAAWIYKDSFGDVVSIHKDFVPFDAVPLYAHPMRELSDKEITKLWAKSHEYGIAMQQGFTTQQHYFAHLLLKKAREK